MKPWWSPPSIRTRLTGWYTVVLFFMLLVYGTASFYDYHVFGNQAVDGIVTDIQSDNLQGTRRIFVAFDNGAIGVYTGN